MKPQNNGFFHRLTYKTMVVSVDEDGNPTKVVEKKRSLILVWIGLYVLVFGLCFIFLPMNNKVRFDQLGNIISQLFVPSKWSLKTSEAWWDYLWTVAVKFGTLLAVPFYLLAASNITRSKAVNQLVRILVNIIRTIPTFVLAIIGAIFYGYSETAGVFAMTLFTFGIIFKLMYEYIETVDMNPFEVSISNGGTRLSAYALSIHPQVNPMFISNFIYTFEINIRASVVLGFVGAGGIGQLLSDAMEATQYDKIGAILIPLLVVVFVLQLVSTFTRRKAI